MLYIILNAFGFFLFFVVAGFSAVLLLKTNRKHIIKVIMLSALTVFPGYLAWNCFRGMTQGELYKDETYVHLKRVLSGDESGSIGVMAIRAGYNAYGFELESIDVDNIWSGKIKFNEKKIPYNLYEVNTLWRNRAKGIKEKKCFLYSWANDIENDYRREIQFFNDCDKKEEAIRKVIKNSKT